MKSRKYFWEPRPGARLTYREIRVLPTGQHELGTVSRSHQRDSEGPDGRLSGCDQCGLMLCPWASRDSLLPLGGARREELEGG